MATKRYLIEAQDDMFMVMAWEVEEAGTTEDLCFLYKQTKIAFADLKPHFLMKLARDLKTRYEADETKEPVND